MKNKIFSIGFVLIANVLLATQCFAQDTSRMDQVVQSYVDAKQFMGTVLVARDDKIIFEKAYGSANLEWNIPNDPTTKFRLGSITKQFTAASILLLEERGKLKVEDSIKKYLPGAPASWDKITLYNLLTHTAGIKNFTDLPEYRALQLAPATPAKLMSLLYTLPLDFTPGEKMQYSNSGYIVLGEVIEKLSGMSYERFLQENIFNPLGMKDSGYDSNTAIIAHRAAGYSSGPNGIRNAEYIDMSVPYGAGALYSTTQDLLRWERALFGGKLLSAASFKKMTTPFKSDYAFGLLVNEMNGRKVIQHNGGIPGFNTNMAYFPESKMTVVALSNLNGPAPGPIVAKLGALAHGDSVQLNSERKEISLAPDTLKKYVGTYALGPNTNMMVTLDGAQLLTQVSGQRKLPIFPESETHFFVKAVDAQLEFLEDATGNVTHLVLHQGGRDMKAPRTSDTVLERHEISLPVETLKRYVGVYELRPGFELTITFENDQLMAQATGQGKSPIFPESERSFFSKLVDAHLDFESNQDGDVTGVVLHQGPTNARAAKK